MSTDFAASAYGTSIRGLRVLPALDRRRTLFLLLRLAAGLCFISHGAFGILGKEAWLPYFALFGIGSEWAFSLMPLVGAVDIAVGVLVIVRPRPAYLAYMVGWAVWTAALRPLTGEPVWELLERAGNYGVPLALLLLVLARRRPETEETALPRATTVLRWSTALLLFGHGALGLLTGKALLVEHYAAIGLSGGWVPVVGAAEILMAVAALRARRPGFFLGVFFWKVASESFFLAAGSPVWEFVERAGSYAAPLALVLLLAPRASGATSRFRAAVAAALLAASGLPFPAGAQTPRIELEEPVLVSGGIDHPLTEPHLVVDPNDPDHLLVAAITAREPQVRGSRRPASHITLFQSWDRGRTWGSRAFDEGIELGADPWLAMNDSGVVVLASLNGISGPDAGVFLLTFVSPDGGRTWSGPTNLGRAHDRETVAVHPPTGDFLIHSTKQDVNPEGDVRWAVSTIHLDRLGVFRRSGLTFPSSVEQNTTEPVFTEEGDVFVPFIDYLAQGELLETRRAWLLRSDNRGATYSEPVLITEQEWGSTHLALDRTGPRAGRLYYLLTMGGRGENDGYTLLHSDDRGETWSAGVPVATGAGADPDMRNAAMAVNARGVVLVTWYDRRDDPCGERQDLYVAASVDGGESFLDEVRVTEWSSDPLTGANGWTAERWPAGGDYHGLAPLPDGSFQVVWAASPDGLYRLYTTRVRIRGVDGAP